jgi:recombination protein RecT
MAKQEVATTPPGAVGPPAQQGIKSVSSFLNSEQIKTKFMEVLGQRANAFISSVLAACNMNEDLKKATTESIYTAALMAATLDLPINPNLSFAYLIPYKTNAGKSNEVVECQFQIGAKGFKQLAQRTGKYLLITDAVVYEGQLVEENPLTGYKFDWKAKKSGTIIGYVSYFELVNGFKSTFYMSAADMNKHALRYSQTFKSEKEWVKKKSKWFTDFEVMALKTVTKLNLSKNGPLSIEMEKAMITDQAVIKDADTLDVEYEDNKPEDKTILPEDLQIMVDSVADKLSPEEFKDATRIIENKEVASYSKLKILLEAKSETPTKP